MAWAGKMPLMKAPRPKRPRQLPDHSEDCLRALVDKGVADKISLGGALGLLHYLDYRSTRDVDAWWAEGTTEEDRRQVAETLESVLRSRGEVAVRSWGDVVSVELKQGGRKVFSFQVAGRSARLEPPDRAPWIAVPLDSFPDLVAAKMTALVERGAPRDFRDIHALCRAGMTTPEECWNLWGKREKAAGSDAGVQRARLAVATHLARIIQHRRLEDISDPRARAEAEQVRDWFKQVFLGQADEQPQLD